MSDPKNLIELVSILAAAIAVSFGAIGPALPVTSDVPRQSVRPPLASLS